MALPSFFKRKDSRPTSPKGAEPGGDDAGPVQAARMRARRRLIGAVVLLAIGVIGFPMLFETQPRPLPSDITIEMPRREAAASQPPALPTAPPTVAHAPQPATPAATASAPGLAAASVTSAALPASARSAGSPTAPASTALPADGQRPAPPRADLAALAAAREAEARLAEAERARALLEGRVAAATAPALAASEPRGGRFVVQVGAFTDANTLRTVRAKVEGLGLKTYTQSIDTDAGTRTRVRVGPFNTRQEAEAASGKLKDAGLPGNVLVL
jgi:DedD protein